MSIVLNEDGTAKVSVRFGIRKGEPGYSSQEVSMSADVDVIVEADGPTAALAELGTFQDFMLEQTKAGVIAALGMDAMVDDGGTTHPIFKSQAPPAPVAIQPQAVAQPAPQAAAPQGDRQFAPPKATKEQLAMLPRYQVDFGKGVQVYVDQRPLKAPLGPYSAKAPDFKNAADRDDGVWVTGPQGNPNTQVVAAMTAASIPATVQALPPAPVPGPDEAPF